MSKIRTHTDSLLKFVPFRHDPFFSRFNAPKDRLLQLPHGAQAAEATVCAPKNYISSG
jgi:hypothetical protein